MEVIHLLHDSKSAVQLSSVSLHTVITNQRWDLVDFINRNNILDSMNTKNIYKQTPLHRMISENKRDSVLLAVQHGADICLKDKNGVSAFCQVFQHKQWDLLPALLPQETDPWKFYSQIIDIFARQTEAMYQPSSLQYMLQFLPTPQHLHKLDFTFRFNSVHIAGIHVNDNDLHFPQLSRSYVKRFVDIVFILFERTCFVSLDDSPMASHKHLHSIDDDNKSIHSIIASKLEHLWTLHAQVTTLQKMCIFCIRENLPCKSDEDFGKLGLAPGLLHLVKFQHVADEIYEGRLEEVEDLSMDFDSLFY